jgi:Ca-activated chloride channel family protein
VADFARENQTKLGELAKNRDALETRRLQQGAQDDKGDGAQRQLYAQAAAKKAAFDLAKDAMQQGRQAAVQAGRLGIDFAVEANNLRNQSRLALTAVRNVAGRNCLEIGGIWIDDRFDPKMAVVTVKAQSPAYFRILDRQPGMKDVYRLGNHVLWVTPNGTALVIDTTGGKEELSDEEIDSYFAVKKGTPGTSPPE